MRRLDTEKSFYRKNEGLIGGWWTEIIQAIGKGDDLGIGEILSQLLGAAMEIADMGINAGDVFAFQFEDQPQHPVSAGMLGPQVEKNFLGASAVLLYLVQYRYIRHLFAPDCGEPPS